MAIAALLHDAVEDQGGEPRLVRKNFEVAWHSRSTLKLKIRAAIAYRLLLAVVRGHLDLGTLGARFV